jgi:hypothetical protein
MLTEKEKLEEELKLLEESLSLNVITKQEYENVKQKVESKLNELRALEQKREDSSEEKPEAREEGEIKEEPKPEEEKEEEKPKITEIKEKIVKPVEEEKEEEKTEIKKEESAEEEQKKIEEVKEVQEETKEETKAEEKPEAREEGEIKEEPKPEEEKEEEKPLVTVVEEEKSSKKIFAYIGVILFLVVGSWYFFFSGGSNDADAPIEAVGEPISLIACNSDEDCSKETGIGICNNPGTEDAECEYIEDVKVKLTVLNSNDCFNCDTGRILSILKKNFPNLDIKNIDFETEEGKDIVEKYDIKVLPAYIFNSSFEEAYNYNKLSSGLREVKGDFVMKNTVANANYYIEREEMPNKLDLFVKLGQIASKMAEDNLEEFLDTFEGNVNFEKHSADSQIVKELGINSFPAFLINNKIKFSGVQSADKIRENFCQLNSVTECALGLTKSLV